MARARAAATGATDETAVPWASGTAAPLARAPPAASTNAAAVPWASAAATGTTSETAVPWARVAAPAATYIRNQRSTTVRTRKAVATRADPTAAKDEHHASSASFQTEPVALVNAAGIILCAGCDEDASSVSHKCDVCGRANHVFCGVPICEGFGGTVRYHGCVSTLSLSSTHSPEAAPRQMRGEHVEGTLSARSRQQYNTRHDTHEEHKFDEHFDHEDISIVEAHDRAFARQKKEASYYHQRQDALGILCDVNLSIVGDLDEFEALVSDATSDDSDHDEEPSALDADFVGIHLDQAILPPHATATGTTTDEELDEYFANLVDINDDDALLPAARNRDEIRSWQEDGWEEGK
jgi:hypothetical protein